MKAGSLLGSLGLLAVGCATPSTVPRASASAHATSAVEHAGVAADHAVAPADDVGERRWCVPPRGAVGFCWSSLASGVHRTDAEHHRRTAAEHRAHSQALKQAEARACAGVADAERDESPFSHRDDIVRVDIDERQGATVVFRAIDGMSVASLQRVIDCHLARNAALGNDVPEMAYCPLVPAGVVADVRTDRDGFAVVLHTTDAQAAAVVFERVVALRPASSHAGST